MSMTGRYRFRHGFRGVQILQVEHDTPMFIGGQVDASMRQLSWSDATPSQAQDVLDRVNRARARKNTIEDCAEPCPIEMIVGGWKCTRCAKIWNHVVIPTNQRVCGKVEEKLGL